MIEGVSKHEEVFFSSQLPIDKRRILFQVELVRDILDKKDKSNRVHVIVEPLETNEDESSW